MALQAYRGLIRSARIAFQNDTPSLTAAMSQIRGGFREKANSDPSDDAITAAIQYANDVAKILRENVVQGQREEGTELKYKLRIHEQTEKGDNESINTAGSGGATAGGCARR